MTALLKLIPWETILLYVVRKAAKVTADQWRKLQEKVREIDAQDLPDSAKRLALANLVPFESPKWAVNFIVEALVLDLRLSQ